MKILTAYKAGLVGTISRLRLVTIVYLFVFIPSLLVAMAYLSAYNKAIGLYLAPEKLMHGFDYTTYTELMRFEGDGISAIVKQAFWLVVFYVPVSLFVTGGILYLITGKYKPRLASFVNGGAKYFWRILKLKFYFSFVQLFFAFIIYLPFGISIAMADDGSLNEKMVFFKLLPYLIVHLLVVIYLFTIVNYAKIIIVSKDTRKVLRSIWEAVKFVTGKFAGAYSLTLLLMIVPLLLIYVYFKVFGFLSMDSGWVVFGMFVIQQLFLWLRAAMRIWFLAGLAEYYRMRR
ncbi:MAG: hypothetical protein GXO47_11140 [Chlorobi bacterium]|nr:hypothetical protein [Chlorobiota bacterium]